MPHRLLHNDPRSRMLRRHSPRRRQRRHRIQPIRQEHNRRSWPSLDRLLPRLRWFGASKRPVERPARFEAPARAGDPNTGPVAAEDGGLGDLLGDVARPPGWFFAMDALAIEADDSCLGVVALERFGSLVSDGTCVLERPAETGFDDGKDCLVVLAGHCVVEQFSELDEASDGCIDGLCDEDADIFAGEDERCACWADA